MRFDLHPFKNLEEAREWARAHIDQAAGTARARYITTVPGQDATYQAKYADALAFARADYPEDQLGDYPWVQAESLALGGSSRDAADSIRKAGDPWNTVVGPAIERIRIGAKVSLTSCIDIKEVLQIAAGARCGLDAI